MASGQDVYSRPTTVLLATALVEVQVGLTMYMCRALCDSGAQMNLISESCVQRLGARKLPCDRVIRGIGNNEGITLNKKVFLDIRSCHTKRFVLTAEFTVINELMGSLPYNQLRSLNLPSNVPLADPEYNIPSKIDLLFGAGIWASSLGPGIYRNSVGTILQETEFGFIILGRYELGPEDECFLTIFHANEQPEQFERTEQGMNEVARILKRFWEIQELSSKRIRSPQEELVERIFAETHYRERNGRYVVNIPFVPESKPLGESREIALKRFLWLERRLQRDPQLREKYVKFMQEYEQLGHMQVAMGKPKAGERLYYIPHHCVTAKFRVVFDASCKTTSGESLNDIQLVGEKLQFDLADVIVRFRRHKIAIAGDIKKMFRQVGVDPKHWDCQRILWREHPSQPLREYWLTVVTYGMSSSVHSSVRAMKQCAIDNANKWPRAEAIVHQDFYVDDCFTGADTIDEAITLRQDLDNLLRAGCFELAKWSSNDGRALEDTADTNSIIELGEDGDTKVLGLRWLTASDELTFRVVKPLMSNHPTMREVLSEIAKLYDPNGFLSPIIIRPKIIMQEIWRANVGWDHKIPPEILERWNEFYQTLDRLQEIKIPRWFWVHANDRIQLHGFADASEKAYGAVIYVRVVTPAGDIRCQLVASKSRVAPTSTVSIPRLELQAAELLGRLLKNTVETCQFKNVECCCWTDSTVVLHWLRKQPCELKTFVANRVASIQTTTDIRIWAHVVSGDNPADLVSRGMGMSEFIGSELWFHGSPWLSTPQEQWPRSIMTLTPKDSGQIKTECKSGNNLVVLTAAKIPQDALIYKFSSWDKVMRITAYTFRFINNCRKKQERIVSKTLTREELQMAINHWLRTVQNEHFSKEIQCRHTKDVLPERSKIAGLNPQLNAEGILCVGGRLSNTDWPESQKHQAVIPAKSRLGWLLLQKAHHHTLHGGVQQMMRYIRSNFWIPRLRAEARLVVMRCARCFRMSKKTETQLMGSLPSDRVRPARPFYNSGVDFAGPYDMRMRAGRPASRKQTQETRTEKGYVAVFVCLVTRAVHLEAVTGMTSEAFIAAFSRFCARRGICAKMYSDNGTTFVGANKEMLEAMLTWQQKETLDYVQSRGTEWHFITPSAPFQGGIWEAAVKSMKHHLKRVMGTQKYSYEVLSTLLAEIEACLNSRPICAMSDDSNDAQALTPAHFLIGEELVLPIPVRRDEPPRSARALWQQQQYSKQSFWSQWSADYLNTLQQRNKWKWEKENVRIGQLALLKNENFPPTYWALGRITAVQPGKDKLVRSVTIEIDGRLYDRPIQKLCILPSEDELDYWH